jgi:hypothetical protein
MVSFHLNSQGNYCLTILFVCLFYCHCFAVDYHVKTIIAFIIQLIRNLYKFNCRKYIMILIAPHFEYYYFSII